MKRLIQFLARLYPESWRARYEQEFNALLEDVNPSWRTSFDILKGAFTMRWQTSSPGKIIAFAATTGVAGLIIALAIWLALPNQYGSLAILEISRPGQTISTQDVSNNVLRTAQAVFTNARLTDVIRKHKLYPAKQARMPLEKIVNEMKTKITIQPVGPANVFEIEFVYDVPAVAQQVVQDLTSQFIDVRFDDPMAKTDLLTLRVLNPPSLPTRPFRRNPTPIAVLGLTIGLIVGFPIAFVRRSPNPS